MKLRKYLDFIDKKLFKILRVFLHSKKGLSGSQVSGILEFNKKTTLKYLEHLTYHNILEKSFVGRAYVYELSKNYLTRKVILPLLRQEENLFEQIKKEITDKFGIYCEAIVIYGSYAKYEENEESDLDVCFIVTERKEEMECEIDNYSSYLNDFYEVTFSPHILTKKELKTKKDLPVISGIAKDGQWIFGDKLKLKQNLW